MALPSTDNPTIFKKLVIIKIGLLRFLRCPCIFQFFIKQPKWHEFKIRKRRINWTLLLNGRLTFRLFQHPICDPAEFFVSGLQSHIQICTEIDTPVRSCPNILPSRIDCIDRHIRLYVLIDHPQISLDIFIQLSHAPRLRQCDMFQRPSFTIYGYFRLFSKIDNAHFTAFQHSGAALEPGGFKSHRFICSGHETEDQETILLHIMRNALSRLE